MDPATIKMILTAVKTALSSENGRKILVGIAIVTLCITSFLFQFIFSETCVVAFVFGGSGSSSSSASSQPQVIGSLPMPAEGEITNPYGKSTDSKTNKQSFNPGIDIGTAWHCAIKSIADGTVYKVVNADPVYGNYIVIKHDISGKTFYSMYAYLAAIVVAKNAEVKQGDVIGMEGGEPGQDPNPGKSTVHHLHFEIWLTSKSNSYTDPTKYILTVSSNLVAFLEKEEGFSAVPYQGVDSQNSTIGYGHVIQTGEKFTTLTPEQAETLLISDLSSDVASVQNEFQGINLSQNQIDALDSLCYNLGPDIWSSINLTDDIKANLPADVIKNDFESLDYVNGAAVPGLLQRRDDEFQLYENGVYLDVSASSSESQ